MRRAGATLGVRRKHSETSARRPPFGHRSRGRHSELPRALSPIGTLWAALRAMMTLVQEETKGLFPAVSLAVRGLVRESSSRGRRRERERWMGWPRCESGENHGMRWPRVQCRTRGQSRRSSGRRFVVGPDALAHLPGRERLRIDRTPRPMCRSRKLRAVCGVSAWWSRFCEVSFRE